jgi:hypothetical protein
MYLSKSRVMAGLQCAKQLWWMVNEPDAPELQVDIRTQAVLDQGARVGEAARAYVPAGVLVADGSQGERLAATREVLNSGASVVYEAAFRADGVFVSVDILERRPDGWCLTEVKSSTAVKKHYLTDVAIQTNVLRRSGLDVGRVEIMHLNRECAYPDLGNLFVREDVTERVEALLPGIPKEVADLHAALAGPLPRVATGDHCCVPYQCPFMQRCWPVLPPHHVSALYAMRQRALELDEQGYRTIHDLPEEVALNAIASRQRRAVQTGQLVVEPTLAKALEGFVAPVAFLDFETIGIAMPVWDGCHPYEAVPVQFSCHVEAVDGQVTHYEWLAEGRGDPRQRLAEHLVTACSGARTVVAYNAAFERRCLKQLAAAVPRLAYPLGEIESKVKDLLPIVRSCVYDRNFGGGFGLKSVVPALVPELRYDDLPIGEGETASLELARLLLRGADLDASVKNQLRANLAEYCRRDTLGLVKLLQRLRQLAAQLRGR